MIRTPRMPSVTGSKAARAASGTMPYPPPTSGSRRKPPPRCDDSRGSFASRATKSICSRHRSPCVSIPRSARVSVFARQQPADVPHCAAGVAALRRKRKSAAVASRLVARHLVLRASGRIEHRRSRAARRRPDPAEVAFRRGDPRCRARGNSPKRDSPPAVGQLAGRVPGGIHRADAFPSRPDARRDHRSEAKRARHPGRVRSPTARLDRSAGRHRSHRGSRLAGNLPAHPEIRALGRAGTHLAGNAPRPSMAAGGRAVAGSNHRARTRPEDREPRRHGRSLHRTAAPFARGAEAVVAGKLSRVCGLGCGGAAAAGRHLPSTRRPHRRDRHARGGHGRRSRGAGSRSHPQRSWRAGPAPAVQFSLGRYRAQPQTLAALRDLAYEAQERAEFWENPEARRLFPRGTGFTALFTGEPGTGKTMAAQIIAADLGARPLPHRPRRRRQQVHRRDREEPARGLRRGGRGVGAMLLFDEADALFGKRTEVSDATTATRTSQSTTCFSAWRSIAGSPSSRRTCATTSTPRSCAACVTYLIFPSPEPRSGGKSGRAS